MDREGAVGCDETILCLEQLRQWEITSIEWEIVPLLYCVQAIVEILHSRKHHETLARNETMEQ